MPPKPTLDMVAVGRRIRARRKQLDMKQTDLWRAVGVGKNAVSKWEAGEQVISHENAAKVAQVLRMTVDRLLYGHDDDAEVVAYRRIAAIVLETEAKRKGSAEEAPSEDGPQEGGTATTPASGQSGARWVERAHEVRKKGDNGQGGQGKTG